MTVLSNDELLAVADRLGVQTLPVALAAGPGHDDYREQIEARNRAAATLTRGGLLDGYGDVESDLATAVQVLIRPECELAVRSYRGGEPTRVCLARRGGQHALATRRGDDVEIRTIWADGSGRSLAKGVLDALEPCPPADVVHVSAPASELSTRLDAARESADFALAIGAFGLDERQADAYGRAFGSCLGYAEVVAYSHADGATTRSPGTAVVYDTGHGRIVAAPATAPDGRWWTTLTPGTDDRVAQAMTALVANLPGGRWMPP